jgi:thioredoxin 1
MKKFFILFLLSFASLFAFENLTSDNFDQKVSNKNVIVDFYYTW